MSNPCPICENANENNENSCPSCGYDLEEDLWANRKQREDMRQEAKERFIQSKTQTETPTKAQKVEPESIEPPRVEPAPAPAPAPAPVPAPEIKVKAEIIKSSAKNEIKSNIIKHEKKPKHVQSYLLKLSWAGVLIGFLSTLFASDLAGTINTEHVYLLLLLRLVSDVLGILGIFLFVVSFFIAIKLTSDAFNAPIKLILMSLLLSIMVIGSFAFDHFFFIDYILAAFFITAIQFFSERFKVSYLFFSAAFLLISIVFLAALDWGEGLSLILGLPDDFLASFSYVLSFSSFSSMLASFFIKRKK